MSDLTATLKTNRGDILINLLPNHAPTTVENFVGLAEGTKDYHDDAGRSGERVPVASTKGYTGHMLGAAGAPAPDPRFKWVSAYSSAFSTVALLSQACERASAAGASTAGRGGAGAMRTSSARPAARADPSAIDRHGRRRMVGYRATTN